PPFQSGREVPRRTHGGNQPWLPRRWTTTSDPGTLLLSRAAATAYSGQPRRLLPRREQGAAGTCASGRGWRTPKQALPWRGGPGRPGRGGGSRSRQLRGATEFGSFDPRTLSAQDKPGWLNTNNQRRKD